MKGFFSAQETKSESRPDGKVYSCISCGAYKRCKSPKMLPQGTGKIMIVGAFPSDLDDSRGLLFQGRSGKLLKRIFEEFDIDIYEDCILTNALRCTLPTAEKDRIPTNYEIECCRKFLFKAIEESKPKLIFLLGNSALFSLIGSRWKKDLGNIDKWRGWAIPDQDFKAWLCPIFDPIKVEADKGEVMYNIWRRDIAYGLSKMKEKFPLYKEPIIEYLEAKDLPVLSTIKDDFSFDYETTGLKPHAEDHRIICASVAYDFDKCYAFMMPRNRKDRRPFTDLLQNIKIGKMAQNMKFEDTWTNVRLGVPVNNWVWDTMLASHILDNRSGVTGLKFQTYVQFGIVDYDSIIAPYLKSNNEGNTNSINRIEELLEIPRGEEMLLKYCALDSIYEYRLAMLQRRIIELPF